MSGEERELCSEKVTAGSQTYFFDVKKSQYGTLYLVIGELRAVGEEHEHHRTMISEENLEAFVAGFDKTLTFFGMRHEPKSYSVKQGRQQQPKAYAKWSSDEDATLRKKYEEGMSLAELAQFFERQPGAIQSRLAKPGLRKV